MNMKLFVDDIRNAPDESWHVARTITAAIAFIHQFAPEVISLDHDISHQVHLGGLSRPFPCDEDFTPVAYFITQFYNIDEPPRIVLHTANPLGAERMEKILKDNGFSVSEVVHSRPANRLELEV